MLNSHISNKDSRSKENLTTWTIIDLDLEISRDLVEDRADNSLVRTETMQDRDRGGNKIVVLVDKTSSTMTTLVEDRTTSEDPMMTETTLVLHLKDSQKLLMMIMVLLDNSNREETTLEDRTASEDNKVTTLVLVLVSLKLLEMIMVHLVSLITLVVEVKTALEDSKIIMVLLISLRLLVMIMVHLGSRVEITLEDNMGVITLVDNKVEITLEDNRGVITLEDNQVATTLEVSRLEIILVGKRESIILVRILASLLMKNMEHLANHQTLEGSRMVITLGNNWGGITLEGNRMIILLVDRKVAITLVRILANLQRLDMEHLVEVNHRTLEDKKVTAILVSKEVTTLEANRVVTISEDKLPMTTDCLVKEFNLDRTIKEALLLATKISVQLSILKML